MDLLDAALGLTEQIPVTPEYREEREFSWLTVGRVALRLARSATLSAAVTALRESRSGCELRLAIIHGASPLRAGLLRDFFDRLGYWEELCWRRELSDLAQVFARDYGPAEASTAATRLSDPFTRVCYLTNIANLAADAVVRRSLLMDAWRATSDVGADHDYALKHLAGSLIFAGLFDDAARAVAEMADPSIRLDYLEHLANARESAGQSEEAATLATERSQLQSDNPDLEPQSEMLRRAEYLMSADPPWGPPSNSTIASQIEAMMAAGSQRQAVEAVKGHFPTRACGIVRHLRPDLTLDLVDFQLNAVQSYRRNDLKVEFRAELAGHLSEKPRLSAQAVRRLPATFTELEAPSPPSIHARDPSHMAPEELARFLFDRPVAETEEEERFMARDAPEDPGVSDPAAFVSNCAQFLREFGDLAAPYSHEQVEQAVWHLFGFPFMLREHWMDDDIQVETVTECVDACFQPFADYVAVTRLPESVSGFHMWWDDSWERASPQVRDAILRTLVRVLDLDDNDCRYAALHGLNRLYPHPGASGAVEAFLDQHAGHLSDEIVEYASACRDGEAM